MFLVSSRNELTCLLFDRSHYFHPLNFVPRLLYYASPGTWDRTWLDVSSVYTVISVVHTANFRIRPCVNSSLTRGQRHGKISYTIQNVVAVAYKVFQLILNRGGPYLFKSLKEVVACEGFECSSSST